MKLLLKTSLLVALIMTLGSCDNSNNSEVSDVALEARALGFSNNAAYIEFVQTNCAQGNHENCNILAGGEHRICDNTNHEGQHHNGEQHKNCGENHRACCSGNGGHRNGHHNGGNGN